MELVFQLSALKQLQALPKADAKRIEDAILEVAAAHPKRVSYATELSGRFGMWRVRKGDYRAIYAITERAIIVSEIGHRKDIYR